MRLAIGILFVWCGGLTLFLAYKRTPPAQVTERTVFVQTPATQPNPRIEELAAEIAKLKQTVQAKSAEKTADSADKTFALSLAKFVETAKAIDQRLQDGLTCDEYAKKVGDLSEAFSAVGKPPPGECEAAKQMAQGILEAHKKVRDGWIEQVRGGLRGAMGGFDDEMKRPLIWSVAAEQTTRLANWYDTHKK